MAQYRGNWDRALHRGLALLLVLAGLFIGAAGMEARADETASAVVLARAKSLEGGGQYAEALDAYRVYLTTAPADDEVRATVARLLSWQGEYDEAVSWYRDVLTRHPLDHDSRIGLARVFAWQQRFIEAQDQYALVLREVPSEVEALAGLADVLLWSGHPEQALSYYERVLAATDNPEVAARIVSVKADLAAADASPAFLPEQVRPDPSIGLHEVDRLREHGLQAETAQHYPEAIAAYRAVLTRRPEDDEIRAALARLLSWQGAHAESISLYREVLARHPDDHEIRVALARVLSWQKAFTEARALYEQVAQAEPANLDARRGLAEVSHWQGARAEALTRYEALAAETHDPEIERAWQAVKSEILVSPRAAVGQGLTGLRLPYRDYAKIGYGHYTYTRGQPDERDLLFEAAQSIGNQTMVVRVEPLSRFGFHDTPVSAELYSPLWQRAWAYVSAQGTVNPHFTPNYSVAGEMAQGLGGLHASLAPLEVSFGYRRLNYRQDDIDLLMPGLTIFLPFNVWLTEKIYFIPATGAMTLASQLTWRPADRVQFFASGSFGTSGERIVAAQDYTRVGSRTIQWGATFPLSDRFSAEIAGYYEDRGFLYIRRGGNLSVIYHW
ncbi:MAG: tetratricopeptide repeat protein [Nitrospira sp.]|nr:tetratricopeptide repeat protein [Nitrospira sp.]